MFFFQHSFQTASDIYLGSNSSIMLPSGTPHPVTPGTEQSTPWHDTYQAPLTIYIKNFSPLVIFLKPRARQTPHLYGIPNSDIPASFTRCTRIQRKSFAHFRQGKPMLDKLHGRSFLSGAQLKHHRREKKGEPNSRPNKARTKVSCTTAVEIRILQQQDDAFPPSISHTKRDELPDCICEQNHSQCYRVNKKHLPSKTVPVTRYFRT